MRTGKSEAPPGAGLFSDLGEQTWSGVAASSPANVRRMGVYQGHDPFSPLVGILNRVADIDSASEIFQLLIGQSEDALGWGMVEGAAETWRKAHVRRDLSIDEVGDVVALPEALKRLFNYYFRDDLYGRWIGSQPIVFSSGSFDEEVFGLSGALKACIDFAFSNNWYGYSNSLGRIQTREALAELERQMNPGCPNCTSGQIAVTLGATAATSSIVDFVARGRPRQSLRAICGVPNYIPMVAAVSRAFSTSLAPTPLVDESVDISGMINRVRDGVDFVLLQTVNNPWGVGVAKHQLRQLIDAAPAGCTLLLDLCHEHFGELGAEPSRSLPLVGGRGASVVFVRSLSKQWAAPGLKCGWIRAPEDFISEFYDHASTTYGGPPSVFSLLLEIYARFEALRLQHSPDAARLEPNFTKRYGLTADNLRRGFDRYTQDRGDFIARVKRNRNLCCERLMDAGIEVVPADYSINVLCRHGSLPDYATYRQLIRDFNVSVFPSSLCMLPGSGMFRVSPCIASPVLDEALARIATWAARSQ